MRFSRLVAALRALASFAHRAFGLPRRNRINLVSRPPNTGRAAGVPLYSAPNTPEEFRRLRIAAQADDVEAVNALGIALTFGQDCAADPVEAARWYRAAAMKGPHNLNTTSHTLTSMATA